MPSILTSIVNNKLCRAAVFTLATSALASSTLASSTNALAKPSEQEIVEHYSTLAHAIFEDSLSSAKTLQQAVEQLLAKPSTVTQQAAQQAWIAARVPYQQSEAYRFGNPIIDDWEGQVNGWPLDEGLIDYVDASYDHEMGNVAGTANIIASPSLSLGDTTLDLSTLSPEILADLNELGGSEANVATGYHAIEFLLWGQDLNATAAGAGQRPYTDYVVGAGCSNANCDRRGAYLRAVAQLLISDLEFMVKQWQPAQKDNYRAQLLSQDSQQGLTKMLYGMGSLSLGELAGERMKVALEANSPEDEHDCFSDNTHQSHYYDALGIQNIYLGQYRRSGGSLLSGPSLSQRVNSADSALNKKALAAFAATERAMKILLERAQQPDSPMKFDQMIAEGNSEGEHIISAAIQALVTQTTLLEQVAKVLNIDNLNPDSAAHNF